MPRTALNARMLMSTAQETPAGSSRCSVDLLPSYPLALTLVSLQVSSALSFQLGFLQGN